jgi:hypothetical protein
MLRLFAALLLVSLSLAQTSTFEGRPALVLANDKLELTLFPQGGAFTSLLMRGDAERMNPLWEPLRYARETGKDRFGSAVGHFVCVDGFGPVSNEEKAAGLPGHGEAHTLAWETKYTGKAGATSTITQSVKLPIVQETLTRTVRMVDGENVVYVESQLENHLGFDRPANWAEHATIGAPFLEPENTIVDTPAWRAKTRPHESQPGSLPYRYASGKEFKWPMAPGVNGRKLDVRVVPANPNSGDHTTVTYDPKSRLVWVTALNTKKNLLFGYVFRREDYPWLQLWENYPSDLRMARGLEFATMPFDVPRREAISTGTMFDTPTYRWLPAKSKIETRYLMFYTKAPAGMRKVDDVRLQGGKLTIEDRKGKQRIELTASLEL